MARKSGALLKVAAMLGLAVAAKQLSKKENRDAVVNEYNKVKEDPKGYAQNVQDKFNDQTAPYQEKAKQEMEKVKQDPKGYAQNVQSKASEQAGAYKEKAKQEVEKAKQDPKGYAQEAQQKAKSRMNSEKEGSAAAANDYNQPNNDNSKISPTQGASSVDDSEGHYTKPDRMDGEGQLTTEEMNEEWVSEGGIHQDEELQDAVSHGGLNKESPGNAEVIDDEGEKNSNHNIHVVTDEDNDKNNKK